MAAQGLWSQSIKYSGPCSHNGTHWMAGRSRYLPEPLQTAGKLQACAANGHQFSAVADLCVKGLLRRPSGGSGGTRWCSGVDCACALSQILLQLPQAPKHLVTASLLLSWRVAFSNCMAAHTALRHRVASCGHADTNTSMYVPPARMKCTRCIFLLLMRSIRSQGR